jgi:antitoxin ParD1/3/4
MDVHLSPEVEKIVRGKLQTGHYDSASDVIDEALRLLDQRDIIRRKIDEGFQSLQDGRGIEADAAFEELRSRHEQYKRDKRE